MIKSSISSYIYGICAMIIVVLGLSLKLVYHQNSILISDKAKLELVAKSQKELLTTCSNNTDALKTREDELTKNAKAEVEKANQRADANHRAFINLLNTKPAPVVTPENVANYGGEDDNGKLRDYLNTQFLINQYIDLRNSK